MARTGKRLTAAIAVVLLSMPSAVSARPGVRVSSYGDDGLGRVPIGGRFDGASAIAMQADDKIVLAGPSYLANAKGDFAVGRLRASGSPDRSFGKGGGAFVDMGANDTVVDTAVDRRSGRVLLAGYRLRRTQGSYNLDIAIAAFTKSGRLDKGFNGGGKLVLSIAPDVPGGEYASTVAVQPDGKILIAGGVIAGAQVGDPPDVLLTADNGSVLVVRLMPDGSFDPTFGTGGRSLLKADADLEGVNDMVLLPDGGIVVAGHRRTEDGFDGILMRMTSAGTLDPTFGTAGRTIVDLDQHEGLSALTVDGKGRLAATGWYIPIGRGDERALIARFKPDGQPDASFSKDGIVPLAVPTGDKGGTGTSIAFDGTGVVLAVGSTKCTTFRGENWTVTLCRYVAELARLRSSGALDTSFGSRGWTRGLPFLGYARIVAARGSVFAAGTAPGKGGSDMGAFRVDL